ncbi:MAG: alpha/beta hydrolase [Nitrospinaceae bacterium]|nr:MAG: alpha/beta hydrolase [Nitrospinaceae bacterium]
MLFITNRVPKEPIALKENRSISFDVDNNSVSNSVYFCQRKGKNNYVEVGSKNFLRAIKKKNKKEVLLYIHGFSNLPEPDIFPRAQTLQTLFNKKSPGLIEVIPLIWPCDSDFGIIKDYWDDQKSADKSSYAFARVLEKFMQWRNDTKENPEDDPCLKRINVLAHSMGNRVLRETLRAWDRYDLASGVPMLFRNTFLVAADIVNEFLEPGNSGELISHASRNVVVYFASDDLALRASKVSNLKNKVASRRLGHTGPEDISKAPKNVFAIDCDNFNTRYDEPKGHSYFLNDDKGKPGAVFNHIHKTITKTRVIRGDEFPRTFVL